MRRVLDAHSALAVVVTVGCAYLVTVLFSEKIPDNGGFGWDGAMYGSLAMTLPDVFASAGLDSYYIRRMVPSGVVHYGLRALGLPAEPATVIHAFEAAAVVLVVLSAWIWTAIARRLRLSSQGLWLGAVVLFGNHAILKWTAYYPVLADLWSATLGLLQVFLFLGRRPVALALVNAIGAFTWPSTLIIGTILLVFMPLRKDAVAVPSGPAPWRLHVVVAAGAAVAWTIVCVRVLTTGFSPGNDTDPIYGPLVRLSFAASVLFAFAAVQVLLDDRALFSPRQIVRYLLRPHTLLAAAVYAGVSVLQARVAPTQNPAASYELLLKVTAFTSLQKPGGFLVAHVMFLGPIALVMVVRARALAAVLRPAGPGLVVVAALGCLLFLNSETRRLWNVLVMFVPFAVRVIDDERWSRREIVLFAALTLFSSRVWFRLEAAAGASPLDFPGQLLFMTIGPWMTLPMYLLQGALVAGLAVWLMRTGRRTARPFPRELQPSDAHAVQP